MLAERLDRMEREYQVLVQTVSGLDHKISLGSVEQVHLKELVNARLSTIEKSQELSMAKMEQINQSINAMGSDPEKTPAGRTVLNLLATQAQTVDLHTQTLETHATVHQRLTTWQNEINGVINILKWIGAGGLIALGISILRLMKLLP